MTVRRLSGLAVAAVGSLVLSLVPPHQAAADNGVDFYNDRAANEVAMEEAGLVTKALATDSTYAGLQITSEGVVVSLVGSTNRVAAMSKTIAASPKIYNGRAVALKFVQVKYTDNQLKATTKQIFVLRHILDAAGVKMSFWGPDVITDTVKVRFSGNADVAKTILKGRFGDKVSLVPEASRLPRMDRFHDSVPWYGADAISLVGGDQCTTGFSMRSTGGQDYTITAGHCGPVGARGVVSGTAIGNIISANRKFVDGGGVDAEIFDLGPTGQNKNAARVWSEAAGSGIRYVTSAATSDATGGLICTDGEVTKEICSVRIDGIGDYTDPEGFTTIDQNYAHQIQNRTIAAPGDSGGPVYGIHGDGSVDAHGILIGGEGNAAIYTPIRYITNASIGWPHFLVKFS